MGRSSRVRRWWCSRPGTPPTTRRGRSHITFLPCRLVHSQEVEMSIAEKIAPAPSAAPEPSAPEQEVLYAVDGGIATITLNAPQRMNTISGPMLQGLAELLVRSNENPDV